jgi:nucleotide-binding universal stress UspA family protein
MIVLVSHGRHDLERLLYGSVPSELLHHTEVPMVIMQGEQGHAAGSEDQEASQNDA